MSSLASAPPTRWQRFAVNVASAGVLAVVSWAVPRRWDAKA